MSSQSFLCAKVLYGMIQSRGRISWGRCEKGNPVVRWVCAKPRASFREVAGLPNSGGAFSEALSLQRREEMRSPYRFESSGRSREQASTPHVLSERSR